MSTRRARIKAVAALPQRRKNADIAEAKKKQDEAKEVAENLMKSPGARRASVDKRPGNSPSRVALPSPKKSPRDLRRTPDLEKVPSDWKVPTPTPVLTEKRNTPLRVKTDTNKTATWRSDMFVSPPSRASPLRRRSPVVRTPVIEVEIGPEKLITPQKRFLELQDGANRYSKVSESAESPKPQNNAPSSSKTVVKHVAYSSPNLPETSETDVMDGIVALKPITNAPKPIEILKNEIISENAEVLFDPIVPLPSPTKVRQKLRPVPRLGPMRRNSIPGSASESEDESRRALHGGASTPVPSRQRHDSHTSHSTMQSLPNRDVSRVRNDSVCSSVSQIAPQTPAAIGSPLKERNVTKTRRQEVSRRMAAIRRRKESVAREKLTMFDLIFYNPLTNPIVPDQDEINAKEANKKEEEQQKKVEQKVEAQAENTDTPEPDSAAPVPQIKLGPNGEIVLDEQSLVIKQSEQRKLSDSVVREGAWMSSTGRVYRRTPRTADWSDAETVRFYRALAAIGTDFSLMVPLFPGRSRKDLKLKFKKEERNNLAQIDKALRSATEWDAHRLENEFAEERKQADERRFVENERLRKEKQAEKERLNAMKFMVRRSKGSKALSTTITPGPSPNSTADELIETLKVRNKKSHKKPIVIPDSPEKSQTSALDKNRDFATLTPLAKPPKSSPKVGIRMLPEMATLHKTKSPSVRPVNKSPVVLNAVTAVSTDITPGSLVVLTVDDPKAPSQKAIHTYIKQADGSIASVILDPNVMSSLVNYVKNDTPKAGSSTPGSVHSDRSSVGASPNKRKRKSSYTITQL